MARKSAPISTRAVALWAAGDEAGAAKLAKLQSRQLRNRLGAPGRGPALAQGPIASSPARAAKAPPWHGAGPSPAPASPPDPTVAEIERIDTREEAEAIYRDVRARMSDGTVPCPGCGKAVPVGADPVRFSSLAEKGLAALNRIEQIDARRPKPQAPDEVQEAIRQAMSESADHLLRHTVPAAERWARLLPRMRVTLGIAAPDMLRELDTLTGGAA